MSCQRLGQSLLAATRGATSRRSVRTWPRNWGPLARSSAVLLTRRSSSHALFRRRTCTARSSKTRRRCAPRASRSTRSTPSALQSCRSAVGTACKRPCASASGCASKSLTVGRSRSTWPTMTSSGSPSAICRCPPSYAQLASRGNPSCPIGTSRTEPNGNSVRPRRGPSVTSSISRGGWGTLIPGEDAVTSFFATAMRSADTSLLHDGSVLLMYCCGAIRYNVTTLDAGRVREWNDQLRQRVRDLLGQEPAPNRRAALLQTLGHLAAHPDLPSMPSLGAGDAADEMPDVADLMEEPGQLRSDLSVKPDPDLVLVDLEEAMTAWVALAGLLEEASMFPVESFAEQVALLA